MRIRDKVKVRDEYLKAGYSLKWASVKAGLSKLEMPLEGQERKAGKTRTP